MSAQYIPQMSVVAWKRPLQCTVLGGGISGMTFAYYLNKLCKPGSVHIRILERNDRLGGWINTKQVVVEETGRDHLFFVGARTASLSDSSSAILLSMAYELGMTNDVLLSHKDSVGANDRYLCYNNKLVDIPLKPSLTNLPFILAPIPMQKPYSFGYYPRMAMGMYFLRRLSSDTHLDEYVLKNVDHKTLDDVFKMAFTKDIIKYTLEPLVQGICGCRTDEISATVFFREFGAKLFRKLLKEYDLKPYYTPPQHPYELPFHDRVLDRKEDVNLQLFYADLKDEKQAIDFRLYQFIYYNKFDFWTLKYGFCSLIEEIASYLSAPEKHASIELNTDVTRIGPSNVDVRRYYSRHLERRKKGSIMEPLKETAMEIVTNGADVVDADIVVSSLPLNQLRKMLPYGDLVKVLPSLDFSSHVTLSVLYWRKSFKRPVTGFGFLVPYDQQDAIPVSGCIFDHGVLSHGCTSTEFFPLKPDEPSTYGFTFIIRKEILLNKNIDPSNENAVFKVAQQTMKTLFDVDDNPIAHSFEMCNNALPIFRPMYLEKYDAFESTLKKIIPNLHIIGSSKGVYTINGLAVVALKKAFEIAVENNILDPSFYYPLED